MSTKEAALPVGSILAERYQIRRELGRGGMGFVYLCRDLELDERVALKLMPQPKGRSGSRSADSAKRSGRKARHDEAWFFYEEARALAGLHHPSIVRARDYGSLADGSPYLVMDVAPGRSLHEWIYRAKMEGLLPWPVVWTVIDQVLSGLGHAHARGVIHGDLKPSNILLDRPPADEPPRIYILDLGLAWLMRDPVDHRLDGTEEVAPTVRYGAGTPGWMAPEQIRMATPHIGPSTDLYPLGCLLYTLLVGDEPFDGTNQELLDQHKREPLPDLKLADDVPGRVREVVKRMTQKWPWQRYTFAGTARNVWQELRPEGTAVLSIEPSGEGYAVRDSRSLVSDIATIPEDAPYEVATSAVSTPGLLGVRPSPFVGRQEEREALMEIARDIARDDEPTKRFVLLSGTAGVGKSRLAEWLCQEVHERALMIPLRARYRKISAPLDGVVGALVQHYRIEKANRSTIERVLMNVWRVRPDDEDGKTWVAGATTWLLRQKRDSDTVGPTGKRFALNRPELRWLVMRETLVHTSGKHPLLIWLDDLHRAPAETFQRLSRLQRDMPTGRILLVATMRNEDVTNDTTARARIELLLEDFAGERMEIEPLDIADTQSLLRETLPLSEKAVTVAAKRAKGNPLFALQLLHNWANQDHLKMRRGEYEVPQEALNAPAATTADLWEERLGALPESLRYAALAAAALGGDIRRDVLRRLLADLGLDAGRAVNAMKRAQLLLLSGTDRLRWTHALLQEHLLQHLEARPEAPQVFRAAANALAHHPAAAGGRVTRHRVKNLMGAGDYDQAAAVLHNHIEGDWQRSRDFAAALRDLAVLDGVQEKLSVPCQARHLRWRAEAQRYQGGLADARRDAENSRRMYRDAADELNEAHILRLLGHIASDLGATAQARRLTLRARSLFERHDEVLGQAQCGALLGEIDYLLGEHARSRGVLADAVARFQTTGDIIGRAQCLILEGFVEQASSAPHRARELLAVARSDLERIGYRLGLAQCDLALAHSDHREGDFAGTHERASTTLKAFHMLENPRGEAGCERLLAMNALDSGHPNTAEVHASAAGVLYSRLNDPWGMVESMLLQAQVALYRGDSQAAREGLIRCEAVALAEAEPKQHRHLTLAWLAAAEGRWDEAGRELDAARRVFRDTNQCGDHTPQLLVLYQRMGWHGAAGQRVEQWLAMIEKRSRIRRQS